MFRLNRAIPGAGVEPAPGFWLRQGNAYGFVVSVALRSLSGEVETQSLGRPVNLGRFFWVPLRLALGDQTAIQGFSELDAPAAVTGGSYWEYLEAEVESTLAIMEAGTAVGDGVFLVATKEGLSVGYPVDWVYFLDLAAKPSVSVIAVECLGQLFSEAANPAAPAAGEWRLDGQSLFVYGSELNQLHGEITLTTVFTITKAPEAFWVEFSCEWLESLVVEQVSSFGKIFTAAENPWHPVAGEYLVSGRQLFLFTSRPVFPANTEIGVSQGVGSQFLGEVAQ